MASQYTRAQIVIDALSLAGRGMELKSSCNQWLNYFLRHISLCFRFPELRKMGTPGTLAIGTQTAPLPTDLGNGMADQGMLFGPDMQPLEEKSYQEFATNVGFFQPNTGNGRPLQYMVDLQGGVFRFNRAADQLYSFTPVYYMNPPLPATDPTGDNLTIWLDDDLLAVQGLIWAIYQFTGDEREAAQENLVEKLLVKWERNRVMMGGPSRILPSPSRFKNVKFGGTLGP